MFDPVPVLVWHDAHIGLVRQGHIAVVRLFRHPEAWHFEAMRASLARQVELNEGPVSLLLVVPRAEQTLPGEQVVRGFVELARRNWHNLEMGRIVVEPEGSMLRGLIRTVVASQFVLVGVKKFTLARSCDEGMGDIMLHATPRRFRALSEAEGRALMQQVDQPSTTPRGELVPRA